jgi:pimeloyl-ACP methyl ester carboxylesterase
MPTAVQPTHHSLEIRGLTLHYLDWGNPDATPLVLVHGLSNSAAGWQRIAEHFAADYHVVALDQRGHGESEWAPAGAYDTNSYVADLEWFVDALGLKQFVLVGHSMGGHNSMAYVARHARRVLCAVVNDIPPALDRDALATAARFPGEQHPVLTNLDAWLEQERPNSPFTPEHILRFSGETRLKAVEGGVIPKYDPNASIHWAPKNLWDEARSITRPVLFIRGGRSAVLDATTLQRMDMEIPPARSITLEKSGHNTFFDMESEFVHVVRDFVAAHAHA